MRLFSSLAQALGVTLAFASAVGALSTIKRTGKFLYDDSTGKRFYIKGVAYQPQGAVVADPNNPFGEPSTFIDPLADGAGCRRDLPFLQQLGVNAVRVYSVDAKLNHDDCMKALSGAGIYVIIDLTLPRNGSIDRTSPSWSTNLLDSYINSINTFLPYDNVLAFNIGNEVVTTDANSPAAAFVKAAARDTKAFLKLKSSRALVGYADIDNARRLTLANYLACTPGTDDGSTSIDIYSFNNYEWCGQSDIVGSGYQALNTEFNDFLLPAYFGEFGCNNPSPRVWQEVTAIFSAPMTDNWSGGLAFSYFPAMSAAGEFGMVTISADSKTVTPRTDFNNLKTQYTAVTSPPDTMASGASSFPTCPNPSVQVAASLTLPPTPNKDACGCLDTSLQCLFRPQTTNVSGVVGEIVDFACNYLATHGGSCTDIGGNGMTGVYGLVSQCSPLTKTSFVMSLYYEANNRVPQACSFGGNGTVNTAGRAPSDARTSCFSNTSPTFTPSAPATTVQATSTSRPSTSRPSSGSNGAVGESNGILAAAMSLIVLMAGSLWTML